jgi:hypothetical protein
MIIQQSSPHPQIGYPIEDEGDDDDDNNNNNDINDI